MRRALLLLILAAACTERRYENAQTSRMTGGDIERGRQLITTYGCTACHNVPGVRGPRGMVGPPLDGIASRTVLAGRLQNTPDVMIQWLQNPQAYDPQNAMPNLGVTPQDARDLTAFLYTLK